MMKNMQNNIYNHYFMKNKDIVNITFCLTILSILKTVMKNIKTKHTNELIEQLMIGIRRVGERYVY